MSSQADSAFELYGAPQLDHFCGVSVRFRRSGSDSAPFSAVFDQVAYEVLDGDGFLTKVEMRDWTLPLTITVGGQSITPRSGDRIVMESGDIYEILPAGKFPAAEKTSGDARWKVHSKKVA